MQYSYNKRLVKTAQVLRKNMTDEEKKLWYQFLKKLPITVNRQKNIGNYIVDFYIASQKIVIELDGSQHEWGKGLEADLERDKYLESLGFTVLRYSNEYLNKNFNSVCDELLEILGISATDLKGE